jgi:hypothetical protein
MRLTKALHLSVASAALVAALSLTIDTFATDGGTAPPAPAVDGVIVQWGVFAYLALAVCLLVYALRRRYPGQTPHSPEGN